MRLIDADELITIIDKINPVDYGSIFSYEAHDAARDALSDILCIINNASTVDIEKHGKWIRDEYGHQECSECHADRPSDGHIYLNSNRCPNCDAKMS